jgi:hypothetical protein
MLTPYIELIIDQRYTTPRIIFDPDSNHHYDHRVHHDLHDHEAEGNQLKRFRTRHQQYSVANIIRIC